MQLFFILFTLILPALSQIQLVVLESSSSNLLVMYQNGKVQPLFNDVSSKFNCALPNIYIYEQTVAQLKANTPYNITFTSTGVYDITYNTKYDNFKPTLSSTTCVDNCVITIMNNCPNPFDNYNYFDEINLYIGDLPPISYRINCDVSFVPSSIFQWGLFILIFLTTFLIFGATFLSKSRAYDGFGVTLGYAILVLVFVSASVIGVLGVFFTSILNDIVEAFCWIFGVISIGTCCSELLFVLNIKILNKPIFNINSYIFKYIRPIEVISLFIGIVFTTSWWLLDKNWIINDIISCCIVIFTVQFFKFTSLKITTIYFVVIIIVEVGIGLCIKFFAGQSFNTLILNNYNNPLEFQLPTITKTLGLKCSWFSISQTIFPAILISYMKRFDTHRQSKVYMIISSLSFFIGCMTWMILYVFDDVSIIPLGLFTQPILLVVIILFAVKRNQIKVLWYGRFYDTEFKDRNSFNADFRKTKQISNQGMEQNCIQFQIGFAILKSLKIDQFSQPQSSFRPSRLNFQYQMSSRNVQQRNPQ